MCGFAGFFANGFGGDRRAVIEAMADRIIHRGPDQADYYVDEDMALGFRRLSIIDLEGGSQPITNEDGTKVLVFNGEIYNYRELREELGITGSLEFFFTSTIRNNIESENVTVFKLVSDGPFEFSREEIDEIRFWNLEAFAEPSVRMRDDFTPNLQTELAEICKLVLKRNDENA